MFSLCTVLLLKESLVGYDCPIGWPELGRNPLLNFVKVAFLLAKLFSDLDNPDCLDFRASQNKIDPYSSLPCCSDLLLSPTNRFLFLSAKLTVFSWRNGK